MSKCAERRAARGTAGFTLLEVLVALVIIGVALAAAMRGAMALTTGAEDARYRLLALMIAENRLYELRLARERLDIGQSTVACEQAGVAFTCEQVIRSTPNPFFRRVELRVVRTQDGNPRRYAELMSVLPTNQ